MAHRSGGVSAAVAQILKREGVEFLIGYPVNPIIEAAAAADIRTMSASTLRLVDKTTKTLSTY